MPPFDEWTDAQRARAEEIHQQRLRLKPRFRRNERQLRESSLAFAAVEIAYGCRLPGWVRVRGPRTWHLFIDAKDPGDAAYVHVGSHADGTFKLHGWAWGHEAPRLGRWHAEVRYPAWGLSPLAQHPPATLAGYLEAGRPAAVVANAGPVSRPQLVESVEESAAEPRPESPKPEQLTLDGTRSSE